MGDWTPLGEAMLLDLLTLNNDTERRTFILKEIVETETNYVDSLQILVDSYVTPLRNKTNILKPQEWQTLFGNVGDILIINQFFLHALRKKLQETIEDPIKSCLGDVFSKFMDKFMKYSEYSMNHQKATTLLEEFKTRKDNSAQRFDKFVKKKEGGYTYLAGLLIS